MVALRRFYKDPADTLDYSIDWYRWLKGDTITGSSWSGSPSGLVIASGTFTPTTTTIWISGGTIPNVYTVTNNITTIGGRIKDRSFLLEILTQ